jgi:nitroreductase
MDTFETIKKRRSIRRFIPGPIPKEDLEKIVDAGRMAPSGNNRQPWHFIVVTDKAMVQKLSIAADWSAKAGAMIAVAMDTTSKYWVEDGSAAVENMLLAGTALGYGTCWLEGNALPHEESIKAWLKVPEALKLLTLIPVGVAEEWPDSKAKKPLEEVLHWETF